MWRSPRDGERRWRSGEYIVSEGVLGLWYSWKYSLAACWAPSAPSKRDEIEGNETLGSSAGGDKGSERL